MTDRAIASYKRSLLFRHDDRVHREMDALIASREFTAATQ